MINNLAVFKSVSVEKNALADECDRLAAEKETIAKEIKGIRQQRQLFKKARKVQQDREDKEVEALAAENKKLENELEKAINTDSDDTKTLTSYKIVVDQV